MIALRLHTRLTLLANLKSDNTTLSSFLYSLDNVGNRTGVTEANGDLVTWSYDDTYQLTREQRSGANAYDITYTYDPVGNRLTKIEGGATTTYSYDAANQIETEETPSQITTFTFDANGNTEVENAGGSLTTYTWNVDNMCVGIALPSGTLNTFAYDADLKRRQAQDSSGLAKFINDLDNVLAETDSGGTTQVAYTLEPQTYGSLVSQRCSGATAWHLFDALGSTERLTGSDQTAVATYLNTAFGVPKVATGNHPNRLRWVGRLGYRWEADATQYDVRRRRYTPARGRWLSGDPLRARYHLYLYVRNSPTVRIDPTGLHTMKPGDWFRSKQCGRVIVVRNLNRYDAPLHIVEAGQAMCLANQLGAPPWSVYPPGKSHVALLANPACDGLTHGFHTRWDWKHWRWIWHAHVFIRESLFFSWGPKRIHMMVELGITIKHEGLHWGTFNEVTQDMMPDAQVELIVDNYVSANERNALMNTSVRGCSRATCIPYGNLLGAYAAKCLIKYPAPKCTPGPFDQWPISVKGFPSLVP